MNHELFNQLRGLQKSARELRQVRTAQSDQYGSRAAQPAQRTQKDSMRAKQVRTAQSDHFGSEAVQPAERTPEVSTRAKTGKNSIN